MDKYRGRYCKHARIDHPVDYSFGDVDMYVVTGVHSLGKRRRIPLYMFKVEVNSKTSPSIDDETNPTLGGNIQTES